jgi:cation diffusion facilitator CzcD-associated flavoprotein CzcO
VFRRLASWRCTISKSNETDVAIIGAGPYGLSIAAHLGVADVAFRIFGQPMLNWRTKMPRGMHLKSDGFASSLYDPNGRLTLPKYCAQRGIAYRDLGLPVALETFTAYGMEFQKDLVPSLDPRNLARLDRGADGFRLTLSDGETIEARRVIVATGISCFEYLPPELAGLPNTHCSHSADNHDLSKFGGKRVLVIGRGASSTDVAAILKDHGAIVEIVSREPIIFHDPPSPKPRSFWERLKHPNLGLGPSFRSAVYTVFARQFRFLPDHIRHRIVGRHLGPAAVWYIRDKLVGHVSMRSGYSITSATVRGDAVVLDFKHRDGTALALEADHVIAGTGYRVDLRRLKFLDDSLRADLVMDGSSPALSGRFESSVPGLYFVGLASAVTFGPLTRFALGARFTARLLSGHLRRHRAPQTLGPLSRAST